MDKTQIDAVRRFNRLVTRRVGTLQDSYLSRGRPLGEARLIFEIGAHGADVRTLRNRLDLDSGYLSRLLRSLEGQGLVVVDPHAGDARVRHVSLTPRGRAEYDAYDRDSDALARTFLDPLDEAQRSRLLAAMSEVGRLVDLASVAIAVEPPGSVDARWCLSQYFAELNARFENGFDVSLGNAASDESMSPPLGRFFVARRDNRLVGCGALLRKDKDTAEIKRMWVSLEARGIGLARRLLRTLENAAREQGIGTMVLDTNRALMEAQSLYRQEGYAETAPYNDNPYAHHWFAKSL